jgi:hypothetical protein
MNLRGSSLPPFPALGLSPCARVLARLGIMEGMVGQSVLIGVFVLFNYFISFFRALMFFTHLAQKLFINFADRVFSAGFSLPIPLINRAFSFNSLWKRKNAHLRSFSYLFYFYFSIFRLYSFHFILFIFRHLYYIGVAFPIIIKHRNVLT